MKRRSTLKLAFAGMGLIGVFGVGRALFGATGSDPANAWMRWAENVDLLALEPGETVRLTVGDTGWNATRLTDEAVRAAYDLDPRTLRETAEAAPRLVRIETGEGTRHFTLLAANCPRFACQLNEAETGSWACPCDGAVFDPVGRITRGPGPENLAIPLHAIADGIAYLRPDQPGSLQG